MKTFAKIFVVVALMSMFGAVAYATDDSATKTGQTTADALPCNANSQTVVPPATGAGSDDSTPAKKKANSGT